MMRNISDDSNSSQENDDHAVREAFDRTLMCSTPTKNGRISPKEATVDLDILNATLTDGHTTIEKKSSSSLGVCSYTERPTVNIANFNNTPVHLVRVRVEDRLLSIPLPKDFSTLTIAYLEQQAADRYQTIEGTKPVVNIALEDGALLCSSDPIMCIQGIPVLKGIVVSWNVPPLDERFRVKIGDQLAGKKILARCQAATALGKLELDHMKIPQELMVVLKHEVHLHTLHLSFVHVDPNALLALIEVFTKLKNLKVLHLIGCNFRGKQLCDLLGKFGSSELEELDLSYNFVDQFFANLISSTLPKILTALRKIRLASCGIQDTAIIEALKHFPLTTVDLSCNPLGKLGIDSVVSLIQNMPCLKELDISNCLAECTGQYFASILQKCLHLKVLKVNGLIQTSPILPHFDVSACNHLLQLHSKGNPAMSGKTLTTFQNALGQVIIS